MRKYLKQSKNGCIQACLANITNQPLNTFPKAFHNPDFLVETKKILRNLGYKLDFTPYPPRGLCIAIVPNHRRGTTHAVLWKDGKVWHDPYPKGVRKGTRICTIVLFATVTKR
jgi:hypothetical protein